VGGSEHVISYCAEEHGGRGVYLNIIEKDYRHIFPFGVSQHQSTDLHSTVPPKRSLSEADYESCLVRKIRYNVD
jgi:hypothetical protein